MVAFTRMLLSTSRRAKGQFFTLILLQTFTHSVFILRQRYMDYVILHAISYVAVVAYVLLLYDIACQFWINFLARITQCPNLPALPSNVSVIPAIGLFHVHGHKKECYPRYAPSFIQGAAMVDGEILETLWHPLNHTARSARSMSWFSRQEYLDAHMADSNWKKLVRIGKMSSVYPLPL